MICKVHVKDFCCEDISLIENYDKAINSNEIWDCPEGFVPGRIK